MRFDEIGVFTDRKRNLELRKRFIEVCSESAWAQEDAWNRCKADPQFWFAYWAWTYDPRRKRNKAVPFVPYEFQMRAIARIVDDIRQGRDVVLLKSRDMGASWLNVGIPLWFMQFWPMNSFLMVSRNEDYVDAKGDPKSLFWKIDFLLEHQPRWLRPRHIDKNRTAMHIRNEDNGSVIDGESTTGEVARGDRRTAILLDEFASFETKNGYNALSATQSATNCRIFNSTPKGQGNAFYDVANNKANDIIRMHWSEHPEKNCGLYTSERDRATSRMKVKLLDNWHGVVEVRSKGDGVPRKVAYPDDYPFVLDGKTRSPWYDLQCARAVTPQEIAQELDIDFAGSDYQFFDTIAVEHYKTNYCRDPEIVANVKESGYRNGAVLLEPRHDGHLSLFQTPKGDRWEKDRRFVIGADISAGTGASNSALAVYDIDTTEKVAEFADPNIKPDDFARMTIALARWFNFAVIVPDRTGPTGEVFVTRIKAEAPDLIIYRVRETNKVGLHTSDKEGVFLQGQMRAKILFQYRDAIGKVKIINRSAVAMNETLSFICKMDGGIEHSAALHATDPSGASANHGDRVIADALANLALYETVEIPIANDTEVPPGSLAWRMEMEKREKSRRTADELGDEWEV